VSSYYTKHDPNYSTINQVSPREKDTINHSHATRGPWIVLLWPANTWLSSKIGSRHTFLILDNNSLYLLYYYHIVCAFVFQVLIC
jgi:hypothetical protein